MDEWGNPSFDDIRAGWRPKQPDPPPKGLSLEETIAWQQQAEAVANEPRRDAVEAGRRLIDEFVALMKRNGKTPTLVFRKEYEALGRVKKFMQGTVTRGLTTYALIGEGWALSEESDARAPKTFYYVPRQGIARALPEPAPRSGISRERDREDETRVPPEMPPPGTSIACVYSESDLPSGREDHALASYAGRADDLARYARTVLGR